MTRKFDAIVVGSGLGGLTAGALYARTGRSILVLERNDSFGGAATVYQHDGLAIEASLHEMDGLDDGDAKTPLLHTLGLDRKLPFVDVGDLYQVRGPLIGAPFALPHGMDAAHAALAARFPRHADGLQAYLQRIAAVREAVRFAGLHQGDPGWWLRHAPEAVRRAWPLLREGRATVGEVLGELFGADEAVKVAVAANLSYYHDNPDRMSFLRYAIPQASYLTGGGHYVRGGSAALTGGLVGLIREAGGMVEAGREVDTLLVNLAGVSGVRHRARGGEDLAFDDAPVVFGNAAPHRLADMLPTTARANFLAPYAHRPLSISLWTVSIGLRRPPSEFGVRHYSTFMLPAWLKALSDLRETAAVMAEPGGERLPAYVFVDYDQIDSGLNQTGRFLGSFCGIDRLENWVGLSATEKSERKERWMDRLIADLDREFPGIASAVVQREMSTAETLAHYLNTPGGAIYGFAPEGSVADVFSFTPRTRIDGLWLASAYTFGGGFTGAMLGGAEAARQVIKAAV
jgi:phytoene dehydrogenase-like protein